ncbi:isocitrate/isopropylmalate family dehydrogenase [Streptomyces malaysiensis]|uniref:isocitrate/isopropylmalate family dehydrogenase n=1 Tax=Streptomyces malaysiensis TaxID=92644 RepID=UPI002B2B2271|nr:isocitrate/isopropylmalate family dehydrogenase [Streptomyces malaysiensis]
MTTIAVLPGDGIGTEILDGPLRLLRKLAAGGAPITLTGPYPYGSSGWLETGSTLPAETLRGCREADVILSGAVGTHPRVSPADCPTPEAALIELRHEFDLRVSVRTVRVPGGDDVTIVRNMTGGAYAGATGRRESDGSTAAEDTMVLLPERVREVLEIGARYAADKPGRRYVSVDKASVFATSRLWRRTAGEVSASTGVRFDNVNVDRAAYEFVKYPELPAVVVTEGIFGDILSDVVCARAGSPALCGSATINPDRRFGSGATALFEPSHGSSPHRTGSRRSNPTGAWLALADLLDWCPDLAPLGLAARVREALDATYRAGASTYDLAADAASAVSMDEFNDRVLAALDLAESGLAGTGR